MHGRPLLAALLITGALVMPAPRAVIGAAHLPARADRPPVAAAKVYANCKALNAKYPHGVGRKGAKDHVSGSSRPVTDFAVNDALYSANRKLDRDKDGVACEKR